MKITDEIRELLERSFPSGVRSTSPVTELLSSIVEKVNSFQSATSPTTAPTTTIDTNYYANRTVGTYYEDTRLRNGVSYEPLAIDGLSNGDAIRHVRAVVNSERAGSGDTFRLKLYVDGKTVEQVVGYGQIVKITTPTIANVSSLRAEAKLVTEGSPAMNGDTDITLTIIVETTEIVLLD